MWTLNFMAKFKRMLPLLMRAAVGAHFFDSGFTHIRHRGAWDWGKAWVTSFGDTRNVAILYTLVLLEFIGGVGVMVGALTRWSAIAVCCVTGYAIFRTHWGDGYEASQQDIIYSAAALAVLFLGPGVLSVDRILFGKRALAE